MPLQPLLRHALHLLLIVGLVLPGTALPAQATVAALQSIAPAADPMPCADGESPPAQSASPCDCCPQTTCDLSACLGTACLPVPPRVLAYLPPAAQPLPARQPTLPSAPVDTPLRPPIS